VGEAKAFFEEQMMQTENTVENSGLTGFATNFTPQWEDAAFSRRDSMEAVDVPITTDFAFMGSGWTDETEEAERFDVLIRQKLVVVKDLRTNFLGSYIATIIPDRDYAAARKKTSAMDFLNFGDYGNFSGLIIYSLPLDCSVAGEPIPGRHVDG
jgi:hypothetical protein